MYAIVNALPCRGGRANRRKSLRNHSDEYGEPIFQANSWWPRAAETEIITLQTDFNVRESTAVQSHPTVRYSDVWTYLQVIDMTKPIVHARSLLRRLLSASLSAPVYFSSSVSVWVSFSVPHPLDSLSPSTVSNPFLRCFAIRAATLVNPPMDETSSTPCFFSGRRRRQGSRGANTVTNIVGLHASGIFLAACGGG